MISGIITIKGNPPYAKESLQSLTNLTDEVVVVDIGIAESLKQTIQQIQNTKIVSLDAPLYIELIREKIKMFATHEYVFFLDPDEIIPTSLQTILKQTYQNYDYISIPRKNIIFGKWITQSRWWPDRQIRLFKKTAVVWPTDIHKQPKTSGNGLILEENEANAIIHHNYESIDEYIQKAMRYAKVEAAEKNKSHSDYSLTQAVQNALSEFISRFFAGQGYKDGVHGFILAFLQMLYSFLVYIYYWELKGKPEDRHTIKLSQSFFKEGLRQTSYWMDKQKIQKKTFMQKIGEKLIS